MNENLARKCSENEALQAELLALKASLTQRVSTDLLPLQTLKILQTLIPLQSPPCVARHVVTLPHGSTPCWARCERSRRKLAMPCMACSHGLPLALACTVFAWAVTSPHLG